MRKVQSFVAKGKPLFPGGAAIQQYAWMYHALHPAIKGSNHVYH